MIDRTTKRLQLTGPLDDWAAPDADDSPAGYTVREVARRLRVSEDKVRAWIARGELGAVNTAASLLARPRWVIPAEALVQFESRRAGGPAPKRVRAHPRRAGLIDFYP